MREENERPVDPEELTDDEGQFLVKIARKSVEYYFNTREKLPTPKDISSKLLRPGMAFVTIEKYYNYDHRELRGCIGTTAPIRSLIDTVIEVALESAFNDPRFPPLERYELDQVTFEVSVLSDFEYLGDTPEERLKGVVIGRDGLLVDAGLAKGLLLPVVPIEYMWDRATFLSQTCIKAGLWPDCWLSSKIRVYRFRARVWREKEPLGETEYRDMRKEYVKKLEATGINAEDFE